MNANTRVRLLDIAQAARKLHVSRDTIRRRIRDGQFEAYRVRDASGIRILERSVVGLLVPDERKDQA